LIVEMVFYKPDNSREITYTQILDELDDYVDRFVNNLNTFQMKSDQITLSSMNQQPFIKATADILTGYLLTFQILAMDSFDYCRDC
jgi:predicted RNA-binding protein with PIN domain